MIKAKDYGIVILDGFFHNPEGEKVIDFQVSEKPVYIGLLTQMPTNSVDGSGYDEPSDAEYHRVKLNKKDKFTDENYMTQAKTGTVDESKEDRSLPVYITNNSSIIFPEATEAWGTIVGFGLFRSKEGNDIFIWGSITEPDSEESVYIDKEEIAIIRPEYFKITLE